MNPTEYALLSAIVLVGYTVHAVTGFGSVITCLVLASWWFDFVTIQPTIVALSLCLNLVFIARDFRLIPLRLVVSRILPWMGAGVLFGFAVSGAIEGPALRRLFGVFVMLLSARELYRMLSSAALAVPPGEGRPRYGWLLAAGVIHGVYATGGPMAVYALSGLPMNKTELRATLCTVQCVLSSGLLVGYARRGTLDAEAWRLVGAMLPALLAAMVLGSWIHGRIDPQRFRVALFVLLLLAASAMVLR